MSDGLDGLAEELTDRLYGKAKIAPIQKIVRGMFPDCEQLVSYVERRLQATDPPPADWGQIARFFLWQLVADQVWASRKDDWRARAFCEIVALRERDAGDPEVQPYCRYIGTGATTSSSRNLRRMLAATDARRVNPKGGRDPDQDEEDLEVCTYFVKLVDEVLDDDDSRTRCLVRVARFITEDNRDPARGASVPKNVRLSNATTSVLRDLYLNNVAAAEASPPDDSGNSLRVPTIDDPMPVAVVADSPGGASTHYRSIARLLTSRRSRVFAVAGVVTVVIGCTAGLVKLWSRHHGLAAEVDVQSVTQQSAPIGGGFSYWLPADAAIESLPRAQFYCGDEATDWLDANGSRQGFVRQIKIRNISDDPRPIGIFDVIAHGETSEPDTPGFLFGCPTGGDGPIDWTELSLTLRDGAVATLTSTSEPSDYFWRSLSNDVAGDAATGLAIYPEGDMDFTGTVSVSVERGSQRETLTLPFGDGTGDDGETVTWKGIPEDKYLLVQPPQSLDQPLDTFTCTYRRADIGNLGETCTVEDIRAYLTEVWVGLS